MFEQYRGAVPAAEFANVTPERRRPPSWVAAHSRGFVVAQPNAVALRPARIPQDLAADELPPERPAPPPPPAPPLARGPLGRAFPLEAALVEPSVPPPPPGPDPVATAAFQQAAQQLVATRQQLLEASEHQLVELATLIARRVIGRELSVDPSIVTALARDGLEAMGQHDRLRIRIGPAFAEALEALAMDLARQDPNCQVSLDPTLPEHGCIVETELGRVDESIDSRLRTLLAALAGEEAPLR